MDLLILLQATGGTLLALLLVCNIWKLRNNTKTGMHMQAPEPKGAWPIIGHLHLLGGQTQVFRTLAAMADKHGPIFTIRLGIHRALVVSSKETVMECFTVNDRAFLSRPKSAAIKHMGYNGAFSALGPSGDYWRELRKIIIQEFLSNRHMESSKQVQALEVDLSIKELYSLCIKNGGFGKLDMTCWFQQVTMNVMLRTIAGTRYGFGDGEREEELRRFVTAVEGFVYLTGVMECSDVIPGTEWMDLQGHVRSMKRNGKELDYFMSMWLEEHVQKRLEGKVKEERDFMDVLISLYAEDGDGSMVYGHKSKDVIKGTALSLIIGGTDTATVALTWALSLLLNHNTALKTVQQEIDMYVGPERWVEESDIKNLVYLQALIKETMRLYPPGPLSIPRESTEDCHVSGYHVPKGTRLIVNLWQLHRDPRVWTDPHEFQPERFLTSHAKVDARGQYFEYLPFSSGRRSCPGSTVALQTMHLILARLLQGFNIATPGNASVDMTEGLGITLHKSTPLEVLLTPRLPDEFYQQ